MNRRRPQSESSPAVHNPQNEIALADAPFTAHVAEFERWFADQQRASGVGATSLISLEHAILRSYITWLRTAKHVDVLGLGGQ